jgi:hypothetical protein
MPTVVEHKASVIEWGISTTSSILIHQMSNVENKKETSTNHRWRCLALSLVFGRQCIVLLKFRRHLKPCQLT